MKRKYSKSIGSFFRKYADYVRNNSRMRHYFVNIMVGIIIAIIFAATTSSRWGEGMMNAAFDQLVRYEHSKASDSAQGTDPVFFIDITPTDYQRWGEPQLTPRNRLADLIETAWKKNASVVVIDVLLDRHDHEHPLNDLKLRRLLVKMLRENATTKVIFPVRFGYDNKLRQHIFDDLIESKTANGQQIFYRAVPNVLASDGDQLNRFWGLYQAGIDKYGQPKVVWSVPVLAAALYAGTQIRLEDEAKALIAVKSGAREKHSPDSFIKLGNRLVHLPQLELVKVAESDQPVFMGVGTNETPYIQRIRFLIPTETKSKRDASNFRPTYSPDSLAGKIVIIGNSSPETGDILTTPIGQIPGMYLIGNAINTIVTEKMPTHMNAWAHYALEAFIIATAAWFFLLFHSILAQILMSLAILILFVPMSWFIYSEWGMLFNFIAPVVGMRLHTIADGIESMLAVRGKKQHDHHK